ncbi:MAG: hypothetical protein ACJ77N_12880 [Chloroflexota bacterium]
MSFLPPIPNAERVDRRILVAFFALLVLLVAPGVWSGFSPAGADTMRDAFSSLQSTVAQAILVVEERDRETEAYFTSEMEDLGASVDEARTRLLGGSYDPSVAADRRAFVETARRFSDLAEQLALAADDPARLRSGRASLEQVQGTLEQLGAGG